MQITKYALGSAVAALLLLVLIAPPFVRAAEFQEGDHYVLPAGTTVLEDLFVAGNHVEIQGDVDGDLFVAGNIIEVQGTVTVTAYLMGNYVAVHGEVGGDLMGLANQVRVDGVIGQDMRIGAGGPNFTAERIAAMTRFAETFDNVPFDFNEGLRIEADARVEGDVHAGVGGATLIAGSVGGDIGLFGGDTVTFSGSAAQDVDLVSGGEVILDPALQVGGELRYTAPEPAANAPATARYRVPPESEPTESGAGLGRWAWRTLLTLGGFALILALSRKLGRTRWERIALTARTQLGGAVLWGIVSLLAVPVLLLLLPGITWALFGTPWAIALFVFLSVGWFLCWFLSPIVSGRNLASYLQPNMPGEPPTYTGELLGVLLIALIGRLGVMPQTGPAVLDTLLSLLGGLVVTVSYVLAMGGWIQSWIHSRNGATTPAAAPVATP